MISRLFDNSRKEKARLYVHASTLRLTSGNEEKRSSKVDRQVFHQGLSIREKLVAVDQRLNPLHFCVLPPSRGSESVLSILQAL